MEMKELLADYRLRRRFNAEQYIHDKCEKLNRFFTKNGIMSAVVGISGGIDSAVTFALLSHASKQRNSTIQKLVGITMPIRGTGTTNQELATSKALSFLEGISRDNPGKIIFYNVDLTEAYEAYLKNTAYHSQPWSNGQLASVVRTPCLYHHAALMQERGFSSLVVGTTNRDEGAYLGFFGKASDGMVDLQPIADMHKSEVYKVAAALGVSQEIYDAVPSGDVFDGRHDEEMIGAPYWFVELYLLIKCVGIPEFHSDLHINQEDMVLYKKYSEAIEELHKKNAHKYQVGLPAHFIDVMERKVPGGWK